MLIESFYLPVLLVGAYCLDHIIGDPHFFPHPVKIIGLAISRLESLFRKTGKGKVRETISGVLLSGIIVVSVLIIAGVIDWYFRIYATNVLRVIGFFIMLYLTNTTIATTELIKSGLSVIAAIKDHNLDLARNRLSMIVGRDVNNLNETEILKAVIETLSENVSDGVIAPLFFFSLGGMPLAFLYKAVNTLDSMVGYKNDKYHYLGWASARIDDIFNYIPARISSILIAIAAATLDFSPETAFISLRTVFREGRNHASPNSGYPEAAIAGALGVQLGGPATYGGLYVDKPYIGEKKTDDYLGASIKALGIIRLASFYGLVLSIGILILIRQMF